MPRAMDAYGDSHGVEHRHRMARWAGRGRTQTERAVQYNVKRVRAAAGK